MRQTVHDQHFRKDHGLCMKGRNGVLGRDDVLMVWCIGRMVYQGRDHGGA